MNHTITYPPKFSRPAMGDIGTSSTGRKLIMRYLGKGLCTPSSTACTTRASDGFGADPMASKYPSLSPYVYCADNPVKLVDPNGEEIYEFDESGKFLRISGEKGSADQIAIRKSDGSVVLSKEYKNGTIRLGQKDFVSQESGNSVEVRPLNIKGDDNAIDCFKFAVDNSSCEWSLCQVGSTSGEIGNNVLSNSQEWTHES